MGITLYNQMRSPLIRYNDHHDASTNLHYIFDNVDPILNYDMYPQVCCNHEPHLRGNVYVQFKHEGDAVKAFAKFNGRFYASRQISCEFIKIEKWKSAICGNCYKNILFRLMYALP